MNLFNDPNRFRYLTVWFLPDTLFGFLVVAPTHERWMAQHVDFGEFPKTDFTHEDWIDPVVLVALGQFTLACWFVAEQSV